MADEIETNGTDVVAENAPLLDAPAAKKQRAPRRSKLEIEAAKVASARKSEKPSKTKAVGQKRGAGADTKTSADTTAAVADVIENNAAANMPAIDSVEQSAPTSYLPATASDEMADLIALEEENQKLRKTLAEKLRAENADLRKRLEKH